MNADRSENSVSNRTAALWEDRWVRFRIALKKRGVELMHQDYYRSWVIAWIRFIKPRKFEEGNQQDVEGFLRHLDAVGKKGWQIHQAEEARLLVATLGIQPLCAEDSVRVIDGGFQVIGKRPQTTCINQFEGVLVDVVRGQTAVSSTVDLTDPTRGCQTAAPAPPA